METLLEEGTIQELSLQKGDVVLCIDARSEYFTNGRLYECQSDWRLSYDGGQGYCVNSSSKFQVVSRAASKTETNIMKTWEQMARAEKGELALAELEGETIEYCDLDGFWKVKQSDFNPKLSYRVKRNNTVSITAEMVAGLPVVNSSKPNVLIKFETINNKPIIGTYRDHNGNVVHIEQIPLQKKV